jgi:hypothetical protein
MRKQRELMQAALPGWTAVLCVAVSWMVCATAGTSFGQGRGQTPVPTPRPTSGPATKGSLAQGTASVGTGVILGQVVDARDGRPVAGAVVSLAGGMSAAGSVVNGRAAGIAGVGSPPAANAAQLAPSPRRVLTDSQGRFMFYALSAGSYSASASASGYLGGLAGQTRPNGPSRQVVLKDDQKTGNVVIALWKFGAITGTVVDEAGEPLVNVPVQVLVRQDAGRLSMSASNRTDDRGVYRVAGLAPGSYLVAVPTSNTTMPTSVVDQYQKLVSARDTNGATAFSAQLNASGAPSPNASGQRIGDVYLQKTSPYSNFESPSTNPSDPETIFVYQTQFFPAATTSTQATPIVLSPGDERTNVDFQLRPVQSFKVSGVVVGSEDQGANLGVKLLPANYDEYSSDNGLEVATTATEVDGKFTFLGVPPGSYSVRVLRVPRPAPPSAPASFATSNGTYSFTFTYDSVLAVGAGRGVIPQPPTEPTLWAELATSVVDGDVTGLMLPLRVGPRVSGRVEFDGTTAKPALNRVPPPVSINLSPVGGRSTVPLTQPVVSDNGQFASMSLPPGKYIVNGGAQGWILKSAMLGGKDVSEVPLELDSSDLSGLVVTFFDRPAQIAGVVRNAKSDPDDSATIVMMPTDFLAHSGSGFTSRRLRIARSTAGGRYTIGSVLPGDYLIAALSDNIVSAADPVKAFDAISTVATRLTIGESEKRTQELTLSQVQIR